MAAVVYNPLKVDVERLRAAVEQAEAAYGWAESMWFETTAQDAGQGQTASALRRGAAVVIAVGGDGTVRAVGEALRAFGRAARPRAAGHRQPARPQPRR